jgi:hypothetical protein
MIKPKTTLGSVLAGQQQGTAVDSNSSSQRLAAAGGSTRARCQGVAAGVRLACGVAGYRHRVTVDHEAPQPVYQQIAAILRAQIKAGELVPDRPIPSESTLMQRYGVARETARKAVRVLVAEGLVYVVQGRGAYVARHG